MPHIFFTSDEHYGHSNIIKYCNRPFTDVNHMREMLIANHNRKVPIDAVTYHLGDIFWNTVSINDAWEILSRLNGSHVLIWGNHDKTAKNLIDTYPVTSFDSSQDVLLLSQQKYPKIFMSHYAHRVWPSSHKGSYHLFGHSHNMLPAYGLSHDVGVDGNNYTPVSLAGVNKIMQEKIKAGFKDPLAD